MNGPWPEAAASGHGIFLVRLRDLPADGEMWYDRSPIFLTGGHVWHGTSS